METTSFRRLGTMLDCSRNAVMRPEQLVRWMDLMQKMDYNTLMLYTEDTWEVDNNPYFGYGRGRYTQEELKQLDTAAKERGIELIPCIQTLAHLDCIVRWPAYSPHVDTADILLAGDEATYELIENMFATASRVFSSRFINVGMDEAHMLGKGRYFEQHGPTDRFQILVDHLNRVAEIGKKYGFTLLMWSDMFFRLAAGGSYYEQVKIDQSICDQIPDNVQLVYWDYYSTEKKHYDKMFDTHNKIKQGCWFAGGFWGWSGWASHNRYSMRASKAAVQSCCTKNVKDIFFTMWGDNGGECSKFALLPTMFYTSQLAKGITNLAQIKQNFKQQFGIGFDQMMLLDFPGTPNWCDTTVYNPDRYMLFNDLFTGVTDSTVMGGEAEQYAAVAKRLARYKNDPQYGYLFQTQYALARVLAIKFDMGLRIRAAYASGDKQQMAALLPQLKELQKRLGRFYEAYRAQWYLENKNQGFEVQDARLGGLIKRVENCTRLVADYANGKLKKIDELEEPVLDFEGGGEAFAKRPIQFQFWQHNVTNSVI